MKIDYSALGRESLKQFNFTTNNAYDIQNKGLLAYVHNNCRTEFGIKYDFNSINCIAEYQDRVPISAYSDFDNLIGRMLSGESDVLTTEPPIYYAISSGSTGKPKYVPVTKTDMLIHYTYAYGAIFGIVEEYYMDMGLEPGDIFGKIFQTGEFAETYMDNGVMNGIRSSSIYQWMYKNHSLDISDYTANREILLPDKLDDLIYIKVRFALAEKHTRSIHGVFSHRVVGILKYIERNWELLMHDIECGTVDNSIPLSDCWRGKIEEWLPPDPERAAELRSIPKTDFSAGLVTKIWPEMRYILAISGNTFINDMEKLKVYAGKVPIHYFAYAASEGIFGIASKMNEPDAYVLLPEAGFFEFIPECQKNDTKRPLLMEQVVEGEKYRLIFTNHSGLYRYDLGDVIQVIGHYGLAPVVKYCYRRDQVLNIAGEKTNIEQLGNAIKNFEEITKVHVNRYCIQERISDYPGGYLIYINTLGDLPENSEKILDDCLCRASLDYYGCRHMEEIGPLQVLSIPVDSFKAYDKYLAAKGYRMDQVKPIRLLDSKGKRDFFANEYEKGMNNEK